MTGTQVFEPKSPDIHPGIKFQHAPAQFFSEHGILLDHVVFLSDVVAQVVELGHFDFGPSSGMIAPRLILPPTNPDTIDGFGVSGVVENLVAGRLG